jgi:hypothetical protein
MSTWKRGLALAGAVLALAAGPALLTSTPATAAPAAAPSNIAPGYWSFDGYYSSFAACQADGRRSSRIYECRYDASIALYGLWLWVN